MDYLVTQLSIYLGGVGLLGLALGWWVGRGAAKGRADTAYAALEESRAASESELEQAALDAARQAARLEALERESVEARARAERMTADLIDAGEQLTVEQQKVASFEALLAKRDRRIEELRAEAAEARTRAAELGDRERQGEDARRALESELVDARARIVDLQVAAGRSRELEADQTSRARENALLRTEVERLQRIEEELRQASARAVSRESEAAQVRRRTDTAERERDRLVAELGVTKKALERLELEQETHAIAADAARREITAQRQRLEERDERLAVLEAAATVSKQLEVEAEGLRREHDSSARQIEELRHRLAAAEEARLAAEDASERARQDFEAQLEAPWVDVDRMATVKRIPVEIRADEDAIPPSTHSSELFDTPRGAADDLGKIDGIGEAVEATLHSIGVYYFRQIAAWSDADLEWVAAHLATSPDRIARDEWREQAAVLDRERQPRGA